MAAREGDGCMKDTDHPPSPSRSPARSSKCPKEKRLSTAEWSIWPRGGTELGWSDPTSLPRKPWRSAPAQLTEAGINTKRVVQRCAVRIRTEQLKRVRITFFSFVFSKFFTLWREQFLRSVGDRDAVKAKVTVEKTPKRAGATPLFRLPAAQKVRGVAPALVTEARI